MNTSIPSTQPVLLFNDYPRFKPHYTPVELINFGVFGGSLGFYIMQHEAYKSYKVGLEKLRQTMEDNNVAFAKLLITPSAEDGERNHYGVDTRDVPGLFDPNMTPIVRRNHFNWFHWYIDFYYGRRLLGIDDYRITQWSLALANTKAYINTNPNSPRVGYTKANDSLYMPEYKQRALQFATDPTTLFP